MSFSFRHKKTNSTTLLSSNPFSSRSKRQSISIKKLSYPALSQRSKSIQEDSSLSTTVGFTKRLNFDQTDTSLKAPFLRKKKTKTLSFSDRLELKSFKELETERQEIQIETKEVKEKITFFSGKNSLMRMPLNSDHRRLLEGITQFTNISHHLDLNYGMVNCAATPRGTEKPQIDEILSFLDHSFEDFLNKIYELHYDQLAYHIADQRTDCSLVLRDYSKLVNQQIMKLKKMKLDYPALCIEQIWKFLVITVDRLLDTTQKTLKNEYAERIQKLETEIHGLKTKIVRQKQIHVKIEDKLKSQMATIKAERNNFESFSYDLRCEIEKVRHKQKLSELSYKKDSTSRTFVEMEQNLDQLSRHIEDSMFENRNQSDLLKKNLVRCCMTLMNKNFRSRIKETGTQTEISFASNSQIVSKYGLQENILEIDKIVPYYNHPFLPFLLKDYKFLNKKHNIQEVIKTVETYLDLTYAFSSTNGNIPELFLSLIKKDISGHMVFCETISNICCVLNHLCNCGERYAIAVSRFLGISGYKQDDFFEKAWNFLEFRTLLKRRLPKKILNYEVIQNVQMPLEHIIPLFQNHSTSLNGDFLKFKKILEKMTINEIENNNLVDNNTTNSTFIAALIANVPLSTIKEYKDHLFKVFPKDQRSNFFVDFLVTKDQLCSIIDNHYGVQTEDYTNADLFEEYLQEEYVECSTFVNSLISTIFPNYNRKQYVFIIYFKVQDWRLPTSMQQVSRQLEMHILKDRQCSIVSKGRGKQFSLVFFILTLGCLDSKENGK